MRLDKLFNFSTNSISTEDAFLVEKGNGKYPFLTPSNNILGIYKNDCLNGEPILHPCIIVGGSGEGCHSYSYMIDFKFIPSNNLHVLIPINPMTKNQLIYYAQIITQYRELFSYGRIPSKSRLSNINLPELNELPSWIEQEHLEIETNLIPKNKLHFENFKPFTIESLFNVFTGGDKPKTNDLKNINWINSIENLTTNNGINGQISYNGKNIHSNFISVVSIGEGGTAFYQEKKSAVFTRVKALVPKKDTVLNKYTALFIISILNKECYKYSYGRVLSAEKMKKTIIYLPSIINNLQYIPDWNYMESFIKEISPSL